MRKVLLVLTLTGLILMPTSYGKAVKEGSLVLYFSFDEVKGDAVKDLSGNENHGKLIGESELVKGKYGFALQFSGGQNYIEVPDSASLNPEKEVTCMAWIYFDQWSESKGIVSKYVGAGNQRTYNLRFSHERNATMSFSSECSLNGSYEPNVTTTTLTAPPGTLTEGEWQHVAMTFKAKDFLRLYLNGEVKAEANADVTDHLFDNNTPFYVGTDFDPGAALEGFIGIIDEVAVFSSALSDEEIKQKMESVFLVEPKGKLATLWGRLKI